MAEKRTKEGMKKKCEYINRYNREKQTPIAFRFNHETDKDILQHLDKIDNKTKYIKDLIRADMKKSK